MPHHTFLTFAGCRKEPLMLLPWPLLIVKIGAGKWNISVFIVLLIRSFTVLTCALINLARDGMNPFGNR